ncbi:MAG: STAS domain-containing protein [Spirochaetes bacterium]|nr:STAS domain-containing protein [Spirochaetota bacterium]
MNGINSMDVATVEEHGKIVVISINDAITIQNINQLEKVWDEQLKKKPRVIAINFARVERIDSIGLSHLVKMSRNAIIKETELILYSLNTPILDLFKIARLDTFFNILIESEFKDKYLTKY